MVQISAATKILLVIGDPIDKSLSPVMHNAAIANLNLIDKFAFLACQVLRPNLKEALRGISSLGVIGVSVTMPHKENIIEHLDEVDEVAKRLGAVNTVLVDVANPSGAKLTGYNTDWLGFLKPLQKVVDLSGKRIALVGAGGAARAACYALTKSKANITIYNRTLNKAEALAKEWQAEAQSLSNLGKDSFDVLVNASSLGMLGVGEDLPISENVFNKNHVVMDMVYRPHETKLIQKAKLAGAKVVHGIEMLLYQGIEQFKMFTGHDAPEEAMRQSLLKEIL